LIAAGARVDIQNKIGNTALIVARTQRHSIIVQILQRTLAEKIHNILDDKNNPSPIVLSAGKRCRDEESSTDNRVNCEVLESYQEEIDFIFESILGSDYCNQDEKLPSKKKKRNV
jgi:hypothetical protein